MWWPAALLILMAPFGTVSSSEYKDESGGSDNSSEKCSSDIVALANMVELCHLAVNKITGHVYVGGVNVLYQMSEDFKNSIIHITNPGMTYRQCEPGETECTRTPPNPNKVLVIDYTNARLITCGTLDGGYCETHKLNDITERQKIAGKPVVGVGPTLAFIAPGPPELHSTPVLHIATSSYGVPSDTLHKTFEHRTYHIVPYRSLNSDIGVFQIAAGKAPATLKLSSESHVNFVYGFENDGFSYFLTTQPDISAAPCPPSAPYPYISKLLRVCHNTPHNYSYTEAPLSCSVNATHYNLVQAGFVGKPGSDLAKSLGITTQDDVLFVVFAESDGDFGGNRPRNSSALCVYSLAAIQLNFIQNIDACYGVGADAINPGDPCIQSSKKVCERGVDHPPPGDRLDPPITATAVLTWAVRATAVVATSTGDHTVVFIGTHTGHLKKVVVENSTSGFEYEDMKVDENAAVSADLLLDLQASHVYVMTRRRLYKVRVQYCAKYTKRNDCLRAKDPYCGWCSAQNKCNLRRECEGNAPQTWLSYKSLYILYMWPRIMRYSEKGTIKFDIANVQESSSRYTCEFTIGNRTIKDSAYKREGGLTCLSPRPKLLPPITEGGKLSANLTIRRTYKMSDTFTTLFKFHECSNYTNCTDCMSGDFLCGWCVNSHRCVPHFDACGSDEMIVQGIGSVGPSHDRGVGSCPIMFGKSEILVASDTNASVIVRTRIFELPFILNRFACQFNVEGRITKVKARLRGDEVHCNPMEFSYTSRLPSINATFVVIFGKSSVLENPDDVHVTIYKCRGMADSCDRCNDLPPKYGCVWCGREDTCESVEHCPEEWLNNNETCPNNSSSDFESHDTLTTDTYIN